MYRFNPQALRALRLQYAASINRPVSVSALSDEIRKWNEAQGREAPRGLAPANLRNLENGKIVRVSLDLINEIAAFYVAQGINPEGIIVYSPESLPKRKAAILRRPRPQRPQWKKPMRAGE